MPGDESRTAFLVTPIGEPGSAARLRADTLHEVLSGVCAEHEVDVVRADQMSAPGRITRQIIEAIGEADLIVADLVSHDGHPNPNVMYEVGVADALQKHVVVVTDEPGELPFDRRDERALMMSDISYLGVQSFRSRLIEAFASALEATEKGEVPDSPVTHAAGWSKLLTTSESPELARAVEALEARITTIEARERAAGHPKKRAAPAPTLGYTFHPPGFEGAVIVSSPHGEYVEVDGQLARYLEPAMRQLARSDQDAMFAELQRQAAQHPPPFFENDADLARLTAAPLHMRG